MPFPTGHYSMGEVGKGDENEQELHKLLAVERGLSECANTEERHVQGRGCGTIMFS